MSAEEKDEALSILAKIVWAFHRSLAVKVFNPDDKAEIQAKLYKKMDPETVNDIIAETHCLNSSMHTISTLVNRMPKYFFEVMRLVRIS